MFLRICGKLRYLWRAVDQHRHVLDILVQSRRSAKAAKGARANSLSRTPVLDPLHA